MNYYDGVIKVGWISSFPNFNKEGNYPEYVGNFGSVSGPDTY